MLLSCLFSTSFAQDKTVSWAEIEKEAAGKTIYWNAWGGSPLINNYIWWVVEQVDQLYGIKLKHVKLADTAEAVNRIITEKSAGRDTAGSIDLLWINGENFAILKRQNLLYGPFLNQLPNLGLINQKLALDSDFTIATEGFEAPWGRSQLVFFYDSEDLKNPPDSAAAILAYAKQNPGRIAYPKLPDFTGTAFLKQMLYELISDPKLLQKPTTQAEFNQQSTAFWQWLTEITPYLWQKGQDYPKNDLHLRQLLNDKQIDLAFSFAPAAASADIEQGNLPPTIRSYILQKGTIGNAHYVAIPYNSQGKAAARVVANFLLSEEAQYQKQLLEYWGDFTVLDIQKLSPEYKQKFTELDLGAATLLPSELKPVLPEPHPSWLEFLEQHWQSHF